MGAVTYPDNKVIEFINREFVALRTPANGERADAFYLRWTPTILVLDAKGHEHHRLVGFLRPENFLPTLMLMKAKAFFAHARFEQSLTLFEQILKEHPRSFPAPESVYLGAVCRYRLEKDPGILKAAQQDITKRYPDSEWAQRMYPYSLL
jgi:hypothetical protein